jgi:hypothetical protein
MLEIGQHPPDRPVCHPLRVGQDTSGLLNRGSARSTSWPVMANTSALASSLRRRSFEPIRCAACRAAAVESSKPVRGATPADWMRATSTAALAMPRTNRPESVGYLMSAGTTVVSARSQSMSTTPASTAAASSPAFSSSMSPGPQRVVIFINVDGCGTNSPIGIRQNRRQVNESDTSTHKVSYPSR